jgi:hypothetical protein
LGNVRGYNRADVTLISDSGITAENVLGNATVRVQDGTGDHTFEFVDLVDGTGNNLNEVSNIEVSNIDFTSDPNQF